MCFHFFFLGPLYLNVKQLLDVMAGWHATIPSSFLSSLQRDWINYVSLTLLEVSKHAFSVISHQSMWPWRWKVKHVSQEAGQRGIRPLISGPTQSHHTRLPWELKLSLWAMYSELQTLDLWCMLTLKQPKDGYQKQKHGRIHQLAAEGQKQMRSFVNSIIFTRYPDETSGTQMGSSPKNRFFHCSVFLFPFAPAGTASWRLHIFNKGEQKLLMATNKAYKTAPPEAQAPNPAAVTSERLIFSYLARCPPVGRVHV